MEAGGPSKQLDEMNLESPLIARHARLSFKPHRAPSRSADLPCLRHVGIYEVTAGKMQQQDQAPSGKEVEFMTTV